MNAFPENTILNLPEHPDSRPIELGDKGLFDRIFADLQPRISEFTFANLFLFRRAHDYRVARLGDAVVVQGKGYDGTPFFFPPFGVNPVQGAELLLQEGKTLAAVDQRLADELAERHGVEVTENRDGFDYLYLRSALAELSGNRYHKKKNRVNYFTNRHEHLVESYDDGRHHDGCRALLDEWRRVREKLESPSLTEETAAAAEALQLADQLGLQGIVVLVEGTVKAFVLGEKLNNDTSVCHFEKADPFLEGLYQLIDREFCRLLFTECSFVNREQDLGEPNLRDAKLSYHPVELVKKFIIRKK